MAFTADTLLAAMRTVRTLQEPPAPASPTALKDLSERLFPESRNRSKRIHKKLGKRSAASFARCDDVVYRWDHLHTQPCAPSSRQTCEPLRR
jgi:hypothetical protein